MQSGCKKLPDQNGSAVCSVCMGANDHSRGLVQSPSEFSGRISVHFNRLWFRPEVKDSGEGDPPSVQLADSGITSRHMSNCD